MKMFRYPVLCTGDKNILLLFIKLKMTRSGLPILAVGLVKYDREEFIQNWASTVIDGKPAGLVLIIEPTPALYDNENETGKNEWFQIPF